MILADNPKLLATLLQKTSLAMGCAFMLTLLLGCSVSEEEKIDAVTGLAMGTSYTVKWVAKDGVDHAAIATGAKAELARIEASMSTYMDSSDLSGFNGAAVGEWHQVPQAMADLVSRSIDISRQTGGAFDVTVGPLVDLWGFGPDPVPEHIPSDLALEALRPVIGYQHLQVQHQPAALLKTADSSIDLSAIAKGYGVDAIASWLEAHGVMDYLVEVGGELRAHGRKSDGSIWRIAIETPAADARQVYQVVQVKDMAVATSGNYRNYYEQHGVRYSHTLDPSSLRPVTHNLASVTVVDASAATADALATALMVMGGKQGLAWAELHQVPAYFIMKQSEGFVAQSSTGFDTYLEN